MWYIFRVSIPALLLWGLGVPLTSMVLLFKNRRNLLNEEIKLKYGFLFLGYSQHSFYWEFIIMYRKVFMAFVSVFLASVSTTLQGLLAFFVLMISLLLQIARQPYNHKSLN